MNIWKVNPHFGQNNAPLSQQQRPSLVFLEFQLMFLDREQNAEIVAGLFGILSAADYIKKSIGNSPDCQASLIAFRYAIPAALRLCVYLRIKILTLIHLNRRQNLRRARHNH